MTQQRAKNRENPRERIIETARELFIEQGYAGTTINQLIDTSGTHKASFYRYFQGKEDVAAEYLLREQEFFLVGLRPLLERSRDPADFVRRWSRLLRKQVRSGAFQGCRVARLLQSLEKEHSELQERSAAVIDNWIAELARFLEEQQLKGCFDGDPHRTAEKFIRLFQGTAAMFRLQGKPGVFQLLEEDMLAEVKSEANA